MDGSVSSHANRVHRVADWKRHLCLECRILYEIREGSVVRQILRRKVNVGLPYNVFDNSAKFEECNIGLGIDKSENVLQIFGKPRVSHGPRINLRSIDKRRRHSDIIRRTGLYAMAQQEDEFCPANANGLKLNPSSAFGTFSPRGGEKGNKRRCWCKLPLAPLQRGEGGPERSEGPGEGVFSRLT